ncbi:DUF3592 domain-containing protein [Pedobacter sp. PAMC26386]|nr:DUF3592 domain-containing protein [Pedobacter sp. PAMC26386]
MTYLICLIAGILLLVVSIIKLKQVFAFVKNSERAIGRVTKLEEISDIEGTTYLPVFEFKTRSHQEFTYRHHTSTSPSNWAIGEERTFLYDPTKPEEARLFAYSGIFYFNVLLIAIAMVLIVVGAGYFLLQSYL